MAANRIVFLDIESSGLQPDSFPIEIGWVDEHGEEDGYLVRPPESWTSWSEQSQEVHGISREQLAKEGRPVQDVASSVDRRLRNAEVYSDAPEWDEAWLTMLLAEAGLPPITVLDTSDLYAQACMPLVQNALYGLAGEKRQTEAQRLGLLATRVIVQATEAEGRRERVRHRALPDAKGHFRTWLAIRDGIRELMAQELG